MRRDVDRLRALDYPVQATTGTAGGYRLSAGKNLPPLLLDDDEAIAVAIGLMTAAGDSVAGIEESSIRALTKLEQVLPVRLCPRLADATCRGQPASDAISRPDDYLVLRGQLRQFRANCIRGELRHWPKGR